jgi:PD-(D/E)XK nuclease superfamily
MRNTFDQYSQNENRLTHALATLLHRDVKTRALFVKKFFPNSLAPPAARISLEEQNYPGQPALTEQDAEQRGVPDLWLFDDNSRWCVVIESKITSSLSRRQVERHIRTARKRGYERIVPATITVDSPSSRLPSGTVTLQWKQLYSWLRATSVAGSLAKEVTGYFEALEAQMVRNEQLLEGMLTEFTGFHFTNPEEYSYLEAKRVLRLALAELRKNRELRRATEMDPLLEGRKILTGRDDDAVWDFLQVAAARRAKNHTSNLHLTLGINRRFLDAMVTIPDGLERRSRRRLIELGISGFHALLSEVLLNLSGVLKSERFAVPTLRVVQRRYPTQRARPFLDAALEVDLRTAIDRGTRITKQPRKQPEWIDAAYNAFSNKRSNLQMQVGVVFPFERCPLMDTTHALKLIAGSWIACGPLFRQVYSSS